MIKTRDRVSITVDGNVHKKTILISLFSNNEKQKYVFYLSINQGQKSPAGI